MSWTEDDLTAVERTEEVGISSHRTDGSLRPYVTIWAVVANGGVFVRSAYGRSNGWFRRAVASGTGSLRVGGTDHEVRFEPADAADQPAIDDAYRAQYARYPGIVKGIVGPDWYDVTLRLEPVG